MKILSIKAANKNYFTLESESKSLRLHQDTVFKYQLLNKRELDQKTLEVILKEDESNTLMQEAINRLSKKAYAKQHLKKELKKFTPEQTTLDSTIEKLEQLGYINDQKALTLMVNEYIEFDLKGPSFIRNKCLNEGFDRFDVDDALSAYTDEIQAQKIQSLIEKESAHLKRYTHKKRKEKLQTTLYRKGFDQAIFKEMVDQHIDATSDDKEEVDLLSKRLTALKNRYDLNDYKEKQKLIAKLLREGFSYDDISRQLN